MKKSMLVKEKRRLRRKRSVRSRLRKNSDFPRLSVNRSLKHISVQVIDDESGRTLASATSTAKSLADQMKGKSKTECAAVIGAEIARKAKDAGVKEVVLDRGKSKYHGRVRALADAAREGGLKF